MNNSLSLDPDVVKSMTMPLDDLAPTPVATGRTFVVATVLSDPFVKITAENMSSTNVRFFA